MRTILTPWQRGLGALAVVLGAMTTQPMKVCAENSHATDSATWPLATWTARVGTSVGYTDIAKQRWSTLGAQVAVGYRVGPLAVEGEYESNKLLYYTGLDNDLRGGMRRIGLSARFFAMAFGTSRRGKSHFRLFVDAAAGKQMGVLEGRSFERRDYGGGMGLLLDHLIGRPDLGIERLGWQLGWRVTGTPRASNAMARVVCIAQTPCPPPSNPDSQVDIGLALGSSLMLSW